MNQEKLTVIIEPGGKCTVEVKGHKGPTCLDLSRKLSEALGNVTEVTKTPEFDEPAERETENIRARS